MAMCGVCIGSSREFVLMSLLEAAIEHLPAFIRQIDHRVVECVEDKRICCRFRMLVNYFKVRLLNNTCDDLRIKERAISPAVTAKSILAEV